jgi:hypothetical protein
MAARITYRFWLCCTLAVLCVATVRDALAVCLPYADPQLQQYEKQMGVDPTSVVDAITAELSKAPLLKVAVSKVELSTNGDAQSLRRASLYSVQAEAFGSLERYAESREASQQGLALVTDLRSPVYINLLQQLAAISYDEKSIPSVIESIEAARRVQPSGSQGEACLLIALGTLEHFAGREQQAGVHLTQAYRQSTGLERKPQRIQAADVLSIVMSDERDFAQAQALLQEVIDDETEKGATFDLAVSRFMRGAILRDA